MKVADAMTREVFTCDLGDSLDSAARLMWNHDCGSVPVVDADGRVVAMITDRDICMAAYTRGLPLDRISVQSTASHGVFVLHEGDSLAKAEAVMRREKIRRLPVVDSEGHALGLLSITDLARKMHHAPQKRNGLSAENVAETLAAICEPLHPVVV